MFWICSEESIKGKVDLRIWPFDAGGSIFINKKQAREFFPACFEFHYLATFALYKLSVSRSS